MAYNDLLNEVTIARALSAFQLPPPGGDGRFPKLCTIATALLPYGPGVEYSLHTDRARGALAVLLDHGLMIDPFPKNPFQWLAEWIRDSIATFTPRATRSRATPHHDIELFLTSIKTERRERKYDLRADLAIGQFLKMPPIEQHIMLNQILAMLDAATASLATASLAPAE